MPDVALRVDGAVVEGEAAAAPRVRQEDVAVGGRGGIAVLLQAAGWKFKFWPEFWQK